MVGLFRLNINPLKTCSEANKIYITFSHNLKDDVSIVTSDLSVGGTSYTISSANFEGSSLVLTMSDSFTSSDTENIGAEFYDLIKNQCR